MNPYKPSPFKPNLRNLRREHHEEHMFLFPDVKKEINGKKYSYGGEYPYNPILVGKIRKAMDGNGYCIFCQDRKENGTVVIWWRKKEEHPFWKR